MHPADLPPQADSTQLDEDALPDLRHLKTRLVWLLSAVLVLLILVFVPPLISVSRFQRRITSNLSAALGRPVHLDRVTLSLVPLPGFTLENFVVDEDPAFGYEPILRANQVRATLRISSLWSHHVEFSRISLDEPTSLNLVRLPDGRWNFESVLLQASRIEAAPTAQRFSGPAPRFPYIEASGARINLKLGPVKTPFALTESDFALWLPEPRQWRFRLDAHPARTDVQSSDAGRLRLQGTLGDAATRASTLGEVPIDLHANWESAPLAGLGRFVLGRDSGLRGDVTLNLHAIGSVAHSALTADLDISHLRRAAFIPSHLVDFAATCQGIADNQFHSFTGIECHSPEPAVLIATGAVPDISHPGTATAQLTLPALPAATLLGWLQAASVHPPMLSGPGVLAGTLNWNATGQPGLSGDLNFSGESLVLPLADKPRTVPLGEVLLRSSAPEQPRPARGRSSRAAQPQPQAPTASTGWDLLPVTLPLSARQSVTVSGRIDSAGYTLHLNGSAGRGHLLALSAAVPVLGDGLTDCVAPPEEPTGPAQPVGTAQPAATPISATTEHPAPPASGLLRLDLTATRAWGQPQQWTGCPVPPRP